MTKMTPAEFPAGTRIVNKMNADRGVVTGWVRDSLGVRWDSGGTSVAPAHHWSIVTESDWDAAARQAIAESELEQYQWLVDMEERRWTEKAQRKAEAAQREANEHEESDPLPDGMAFLRSPELAEGAEHMRNAADVIRDYRRVDELAQWIHSAQQSYGDSKEH